MIRIAICLSSIIFAASCSDMLNKDPLGELSLESAYLTESDALKALVATYNPLLNHQGFSGYSIYDIVSDNAEKGGEGPSDGFFFNEIAYFTLTSTNIIVNQAWKSCFLGVHRANLVINRVVDIDMDNARKARIIAEAKFLRAYYYFLLVTLFGDVPLITNADMHQYNLERTPKTQIYELIIDDLVKAEKILPVKSQLSKDELGRATKGAAQAYLGKVFLYKRDFENAETWLKKVIESDEYKLALDYSSLFTIAGEFGTENIFEINYTYNPQYATAVSNLNSIRQGSAGMYGYGFANPTQDFVDAFEPEDPRLWQTVYKQNDVMPDGKLADVGNSETGYLNKKAYLSAAEFPPTGDARHSGKNEVLYRYGTLLLWYAEAANENNNTADALAALNRVRKRARQGNDGVLPDVTVTDQIALRKAIWHEQRVEYGMENLRYFDLIRQNRAGEVLRAYAKKYNTIKGRNFRDGINELFPIPQTEIDLSQKKLTQNNGY